MEEPNIKRKSKYPSKKWKDSELFKILSYVVIAPKKLEKPTAQIYYRKLLNEVQISATWEIVKWKMRYLKLKYFKALEWQKSVTPEFHNQYPEKIFDICPFFDLLAQIYGESNQREFVEICSSSQFDISENSNSDSQTFVKTETIDPSVYEITYDVDIPSTIAINDSDPDECSLISENLTSPTTSIVNQLVASSNLPVCSPQQVVSPSTTTPAENYKKQNSTSKTSVKISNPRTLTSLSGPRDLILSQSEQTKFLQTNYDLEKRKLDIEEYKIKRQLDLEEKELQQNFELRKLELEKDERIAKYEIEMRYKTKTNDVYLEEYK